MKNREKTVRLKELLAICLVRGEYHKVLRHLVAKREELNPSGLSFKIPEASSDQPFMHLNSGLLVKVCEFAYRYYVRVYAMGGCEKRDLDMAKVFMGYALIGTEEGDVDKEKVMEMVC